MSLINQRITQVLACASLAVAALFLIGAFGRFHFDAQEPQEVKNPAVADSAPKYFWTIEPQSDPRLVNTHAIVGADGCDLTPGFQCVWTATAGDDGAIRLPIRWARPASSQGQTVIASHMEGERLTLGPQGVVLAGLAPGETRRFTVSMGVYTRYANEPENARHVFRDDAGLADCQEACLLMFSRFEPQAPALQRSWLGAHWPSRKQVGFGFLGSLALLMLGWATHLFFPSWTERLGNARRALWAALGRRPRDLRIAPQGRK